MPFKIEMPSSATVGRSSSGQNLFSQVLCLTRSKIMALSTEGQVVEWSVRGQKSQSRRNSHRRSRYLWPREKKETTSFSVVCGLLVEGRAETRERVATSWRPSSWTASTGSTSRRSWARATSPACWPTAGFSSPWVTGAQGVWGMERLVENKLGTYLSATTSLFVLFWTLGRTCLCLYKVCKVCIRK